VAARFSLFSGTANPAFSAAIARELGAPLARCEIDRFADGEVSLRLLEPVCGRDVFLVQPTAPPVNDHLIELLAMADACRRAAAARITAIIPYYGYSRADKRHNLREPIMGRVVADMLQSAGITHVVTMDLHTPQIEGFFHVPVDTLSAMETLCVSLRDRLPDDFVVVAPDAGRAALATRYAQCLGAGVVVLHKRRERDHVEVIRVVGEVAGRACLIIDDMISTGGTLAQAINVILEKGARPAIFIAATHGLFMPGARAKLDHAAVRAVYVTDTVRSTIAEWSKLHVVSVAPSFARAAERFLAAHAAEARA
jgi:ribose-phosphate pyrophosphokinase